MISRPMSTPMTEAIIRPRVQPDESPRQCRPADVRVEIGVHLYAVGVELRARASRAAFRTRQSPARPRSTALMKLMMFVMAAVGHRGGDVAGDGVGQRRTHVGAARAPFPRCACRPECRRSAARGCGRWPACSSAHRPSARRLMGWSNGSEKLCEQRMARFVLSGSCTSL